MSTLQKFRWLLIPTAAKTTSWEMIFPAKLEIQAQSPMFVKKLLAVGVSNITYARGMFPEAAYARKSLAGLHVMILKERNDYEDAGTLASYLVGAFDAIQKMYLKELILVTHLGPGDPDNAFEMYTFR